VSDDADFEIVRKSWAASSRKDIDAMLDLLHEDAVAIPFGAAMEGRRYEGHRGIRDWLENDILANWEQFETLPVSFRRVGDKLVVYGRWRARGRDSGVELDVPATWVVEVRDGKIAGWQTYTDRDEAHAAVGLRE
jgi:ketosteroid isomerase-like protein